MVIQENQITKLSEAGKTFEFKSTAFIYLHAWAEKQEI